MSYRQIDELLRVQNSKKLRYQYQASAAQSMFLMLVVLALDVKLFAVRFDCLRNYFRVQHKCTDVSYQNTKRIQKFKICLLVMLSHTTLKLLILGIHYASLFHVVPYYWDSKEQRIKLMTSKFRLLIWLGTSVGFVVFVFIISVRLLQLLPINNDNYMPIFLHIFTLVCFSIPCALQITVLKDMEGVTSFLNHYLRYFKHFEDMYAHKNTTIPKGNSEKLMMFNFLAALFHPLIIEAFFMFYFTKPHRMKYVTDVLPFLESSKELVIFLGLLQIILYYDLWALIVIGIFIALSYIDTILFIFSELKPNKLSQSTTVKLRQPGAALFAYRCIQILQNEGNNITRDLLIPTLQIVCVTLNVMSNFFCIRHYQELGPGFVSMLLISTAATVYQVLLYYKLGQTFEYSTGFCKSWKKNDFITLKSKKILLKYLKSCRPIKCEIGQFDFYKRLTSFIIMGKVIFYTGKLLLMMKATNSVKN